MAFPSSMMVVVLILIGLFHSAAASMTYTVGEHVGGWTLQQSGSNVYDQQFSNITLYEDDTLVFPVSSGNHTVTQVSESDLSDCDGSSPLPHSYNPTNGNSSAYTYTVMIPQAGFYGFLCATPGHCANFGMHLQVIVESSAPESSPTTGNDTPPPSPSSAPSSLRLPAMMVGALVAGGALLWL